MSVCHRQQDQCQCQSNCCGTSQGRTQPSIKRVREDKDHISREKHTIGWLFSEIRSPDASLRKTNPLVICETLSHSPYALTGQRWAIDTGSLCSTNGSMAWWQGDQSTSTTAMSRSDTPAYWLVFLKGNVSWSLLSPSRMKSWLWILSTSSTRRRQVNATV